MGEQEPGINHGPVGYVNSEGDVQLNADVLPGQFLYVVEPELYSAAGRIVESFKAADAMRFEPFKNTYHEPSSGTEQENAVMVSVRDLRAMERFFDETGRSSPVADKALELYMSGRADQRWIKAAKPWQIGAALANADVSCILHLTETGYAAALASVDAASW